MLGPLAGAVILTILPQMLRFTIEYRFVLYGLIIVLTVLLRPEGLITPRVANMLAAAWQRLTRGRTPQARASDS
ncbi:MAG: hypothetical protein HY329_26090 [Chloroflexi bacterium]|nr:hypothetical protein [Chloroflexota bacterium]